MHIVFIITRGDAVGGATIHVRDMARALVADGARVTILVGGTGEALDEFTRSGVPCRSLPSLGRSIHPIRDASALAEIVANLRELKPDLVSTHTAKASWLGRVACKMTGIPALFTPHGWAISDRISSASGRVFRLAEKLAAPLAVSIVNVCDAEKRLAERHGIAPSSKLAVIHNGVSDVDASLHAHPELDPPRIAMVARFEAPKDHALLLEALAGVRDSAWELELIGGGPGLETVRSHARQLGIDRRIIFTGGGRNVAERLSQAQIFTLASRSEGFPRSILEAMRAGLPVVASDVGGVSEAVVHGETGLVIPRDDRAQLTGALRTLLSNPDLRQRLGRAGRRRYELNFTFERMYAKTRALYLQVLQKSETLVTAGDSR